MLITDFVMRYFAADVFEVLSKREALLLQLGGYFQCPNITLRTDPLAVKFDGGQGQNVQTIGNMHTRNANSTFSRISLVRCNSSQENIHNNALTFGRVKQPLDILQSRSSKYIFFTPDKQFHEVYVHSEHQKSNDPERILALDFCSIWAIYPQMTEASPNATYSLDNFRYNIFGKILCNTY